MKTLDLHIIDIVHNSIRAKSSKIVIEIRDKETDNLFSVSIIDNGCGMNNDMLSAINDSFYSSRKERKIGMGLSLLKYHSELCGGEFYLKSKVGTGTEVFASFIRNHIDRQPVGDVAGCIANFICQYSQINFIFNYYSDVKEFGISSDEVNEVFDGIELNSSQIISALKQMIEEELQ